MTKISIRFFDDKPVRSVWDSDTSAWWMCAQDVCAAISDTNNPRIYWATIKRRNLQLFANCKQLKITAEDSKLRNMDVIDDRQVEALLMTIKNPNAQIFKKWMDSLHSSIDERSKEKAYELFETKIIDDIEVGTVKGLQQIHAYIFGGLYDFAGKIRSKNISKGGFMFASAQFLSDTLQRVEKMPESSFDKIIDKYVEMNIAHPFMEGNGRTTRIWLDQILKRNLKLCVDWSKIEKNDYMDAMIVVGTNADAIKTLIQTALTNKINDREIYMKGIDYSYYYEEE